MTPIILNKMKSSILLIFVLTSFSDNARSYYENPHQQFDMTNNKTNEFKITFIQTTDVQGRCSKEAIRLGKAAFKISIDACSFWTNDMSKCTIITANSANFHTIGHEVRHCLQGNWHSY
jgi:hypothetical protein